MPSRAHYVTKNGQPPSGGVPPGVVFHGHHPPPPPPPPPPAQAPAAPAPAPAPAPAFTPPGLHLKGSKTPFVHNGIAYLFPAVHFIIHFFHTGARPFEPRLPPPGPSSHHSPPPPHPPPTPSFFAVRVSASLTLSEVMIQLGVPATSGDRFGVTECVERGGGGWGKGKTWTVGGEGSKKRLGEVEWAGDAGKEGEERVVWLAAFDREKHGAP